MDILNDRKVIARKKHNCTASEYVLNCCDDEEMRGDLGEEMYKEWSDHKERGCVIMPGETYRAYAFVDMGSIWTQKEAKIATEICDFYDLWEA